jgi:diaminopimelate decarboxylase
MQIAGIDVQELAEQYGTPLYVYDLDRMKASAKRLMNAFSNDDVTVHIFYAMKANCHPRIVRLFQECGLGADCVSPGELEIALGAGISPEHVLYTGNYESLADLQAAYDARVIINLDDINSLDRLLRIGTPERISFRINPGKGRGKYEKITTGGEKAKFGVPHEKAVMAYQKALDAGIQRFGAHMMTGSGVLEAAHFPGMLELFLDELGLIVKTLGITFEFIDMGGGLGIPYFGDESTLNVEKVGTESVNIFRKKIREHRLGNPVLALEPGRYLVGEAGFLIARVLGIKESYQKFVGIDAGFNTLIRPALYNADHPIIVHGKEESTDLEVVNICGQICENTDILARARLLPKLSEGDLLVITQAGAYGSVMTMPYNFRWRPAEVAILGKEHSLITRREDMHDYLGRIEPS